MREWTSDAPPPRLGTGAAGLYGAGQQQLGSGIGNLLSGTGADYNAYNTYGNNLLNQQQNLATLGTSAYQLPQQVLQDIQSYLGLGQSASQLSGSLGNLGQQQLGQQVGGYGSLLGSGLGLGTPSNPGYAAQGIGSLFGSGGLGGLFGGGASALGDASQYFAPLSGTLGGIADYGGGGLLAAL